MRRLLNALYDSAAGLAALFMIGLLAMVLASIFGRQFNFYLRGTDAYAGYLMAGASFLALAHTLKKGEHIRVTLILGLLKGSARHVLELWSLVISSLLAMLFAVYSCRLVWQSMMFNDISTGNDATALWIPQLGMAIGTVIFAIAFVDETALEWQGRRSHATSGEQLRNE